jgi:hypothetical protein
MIEQLTTFYGRYPGLRTTCTEHRDVVHFRASYLVPVGEHGARGAFPECQTHWITPLGGEL